MCKILRQSFNVVERQYAYLSPLRSAKTDPDGICARGKLLVWNRKTNGRDRDRTDDLYRVNVAGVVYLINSSWFSLFDFAANYTMFGAYCSQFVPKFPEKSAKLCLWPSLKSISIN